MKVAWHVVPGPRSQMRTVPQGRYDKKRVLLGAYRNGLDHGNPGHDRSYRPYGTAGRAPQLSFSRSELPFRTAPQTL
jgi:hypothetical protein